MKHKIYKYILASTLEPRVTLKIPKGSAVMCVAKQYNNIVIWVRVVNLDAPKEERTFILALTGEDIPIDAFYYGTILLDEGRYVIHVLEELNIVKK